MTSAHLALTTTRLCLVFLLPSAVVQAQEHHDQHGQEQHGQEQHGQEQHGQDQHGQDQHGQDQHGQDQHGQEQHGQDQHGQEQHGEHSSHGFQHDFSDAEHWSERFDSPERQEWQKPTEVVTLMEIEPGMTVVDLGAGTGYFLGPLSKAVGGDGKVEALDVEASLVSFMNERAEGEGWTNVEARQVPYDDPQLADASVDRILIVNTWHHIGDRGAYSAKLRRALKPGGQVIVVDLTLDSPSGPPPEHRLPPERIIAELGEGGLSAETIEETLPRQFIVVGRRSE